MAVENYIDIVYRTPLLGNDDLANVTVHSVTMDGFNFQEALSPASSNPSTILVYGFTNTSPRTAPADADYTVTYTDIVQHPYQTVFPRLNAKQFIVEWRYGVDKSANARCFIDFFGTMVARIIPYTRRIAGR